MIKLFSPEAFKDYATQKRYYSLQTVSGVFIDHLKVQQVLDRYRDKLINQSLDIEIFLHDMETLGYIARGENESDVIQFDNFVDKYESYFNLDGVSDIYIDIKLFKSNLELYGDWLKDGVEVYMIISQLESLGIISATSGTVLCYYFLAFKNIVNSYVLDEHLVDMDDFYNDTETGIYQISDRETDETALGQVFAQARKKIFKDTTISIGDVTLDETSFMMVSGNGKIVVPGANYLGMTNTSSPTYFLDYTPFQADYGNAAVTFIKENVNNGIIVLIDPFWEINPMTGERLIAGRARINNMSSFLINYGIFIGGVADLDHQNNGDIILQPSECTRESEIGSTWELNLVHPIDDDGIYSYIQKGCLIAVPIKTAREQQFQTQYFRVFDVTTNFNTIEVIGYPVAQESRFECPIDTLYLEFKSAGETVEALNKLYPEKYVIDTDIQDSYPMSIYAQNSNLQEVINGTQEASFVNTYGGEVVYDNYHVRICKECGRPEEDADDYLIEYKSNMVGIKFVENTFDICTRIYPCSSEGYSTQTIRQQMELYSKAYGTITERVLDRMYFTRVGLRNEVEAIDARAGRQAELEDTITERKSSKWYIPEDQWPTPHTYPIEQEITNFLNDMLSLGYITGTSGNIDVVLSKKDLFTDQLRQLRPSAIFEHFGTMKYINKATIVSPSNVPLYYDATNINNYPFVHAQSISYSDITLIENEYTDEDAASGMFKTETQKTAEAAKLALKAKVASLTKNYIKKAHKGDWDYKKQIKLKKTSYSDQIHDKTYDQREDRAKLPYGYILYSFKDAMEYLKDEAVRSWCTDQNEADLLCAGIEDGFRWCAKTNIAKWMWHKGKKSGFDVKYYGTKAYDKKEVTYVKYGYYNVGNKWYWFDSDGFIYSVKDSENNIKKGKHVTPDYLEDYKWVDETYEEQKIDKDGNPVYEEDGETPVMEEKHRYKYCNNDGDKLCNCWIEESKNKHYLLDKNGYRTKFEYDTGTVDKDGNPVMKERDHDDEDWSLKKSNDTLKINGYHYGNHNKGYYPVSGQFMYIKDIKGWFLFDNNRGHIVGCYQSDATWNWKKYKKGWRYQDGKGTYMRCQWAKINGKWYFFDAEGGYADSTVDDFDENAKTFNTVNKHPELDYNREGVASLAGDGTTEIDSDVSGDSYDASRDGVKAWIQADLIKEVKKEALKQHYNIWKTMNDQMAAHAKNSLETMRNESLSVEVDFVQLSNYYGYEKFAYLQDLYLGDYVHVKSSYHGFDGHLRVVKMTQDCITGRTTNLTLGYPVNSFVSRMAKLNLKGTVKFYNPDRTYEDGYGEYFDAGNGRDPYLPI